jgi:MSHA biogenesis protein MshI|tara:strand:+ start:5002 stop:6690 length:1689 start_codon:yes stop_codon:yes gene_type:complete
MPSSLILTSVDEGPLIIRWPWKRQDSNTHLVVSWVGSALAYVHAQPLANGTYTVLKFGVEHQGVRSTKHFVSRLNTLGLGLAGLKVQVMLRPEQYQLVQIDAPVVPPEELYLAARYLIKDRLKTNVDSVTLGIMRVGDGEDQKGAGQLFVVAAANEVLHGIMTLSDAMRWNVAVIDIQETAQRNLQSALARQDGQAGRANATLLMMDGQPPVLTVCANDELFYTQQFELPKRFFALPEAHDSDGIVGFAGANIDDDEVQGFLVDVQRSLDLWRRSWANIAIALDSLRIYAGERSDDVSTWFRVQAGETVLPMDVSGLFTGFSGGVESDKALCMPLLGTLIQTSSTDPAQKINLLADIKLSHINYSSVKTMLQTLVVLAVLGGCVTTYWVWRLNVASEDLTKSLATQSIEFESLQAALAQNKASGQPNFVLDQELQDSRTELLQRETLAQELQRGLLRPGWGHSARLQLVAQSIPAQVWVTKVTSDETQFTLTGFTLEPAALSKWVAILAASPLLEVQSFSTVNVDNASASILKAVGGKPRPTWSFSVRSLMTQPSATVQAKL